MSEETPVVEEITKSDEEILFSDTKIAGLVIKPWSFGKLFEISPILDRLISKVEERGVDKEIEERVLSGGNISIVFLMKLFPIFSSELFEIIKRTLAVDDATVNKLTIEEGVAIIRIIYTQNQSSIKNALSLLF